MTVPIRRALGAWTRVALVWALFAWPAAALSQIDMYRDGERMLRGAVQVGLAEVTPATAIPGTVVSQRLLLRRSQLRACYERALRNDPTLAGRLVVEVHLGDDGAVIDARIITRDLPEDVGTCVVRMFRRFEFPAPEGGSATFQIPLVFTPADESGGSAQDRGTSIVVTLARPFTFRPTARVLWPAGQYVEALAARLASCGTRSTRALGAAEPARLTISVRTDSGGHTATPRRTSPSGARAPWAACVDAALQATRSQVIASGAGTLTATFLFTVTESRLRYGVDRGQ